MDCIRGSKSLLVYSICFKLRKDAAQLYNYELHRRAFATASGRPKGADKLKKPKAKDPKRETRLRGWI